MEDTFYSNNNNKFTNNNKQQEDKCETKTTPQHREDHQNRDTPDISSAPWLLAKVKGRVVSVSS